MSHQPLAELCRPQTLSQYIGQQHLLTPGKPLYQAISDNKLHSMVLWGPPGTGKTTLARLISQHTQADFLQLSAVLAGVKDIRESVQRAEQNRQQFDRATVLFIDEVHRFNKAQQDALLPHIENGSFIFIGATTENPSFELNNALLSRVRVYVLQSLSQDDLIAMLKQAMQQSSMEKFDIAEAALNRTAKLAGGDGRRALNTLQIAADFADDYHITEAHIERVSAESMASFDKGGDLFYEQISALHKSVRGSDPDAALYWMCRMLIGGCDPLYVARRLVRIASEDIGNADPRALQLCLNARDTYRQLGSPEGELALGQAVIYLAVAAKSNAVYSAFNSAMAFAKQSANAEVPMHIRNAPTTMMKGMGYGADYRYAHNEEDGFAAGENYFPDSTGEQQFYEPVNRGLENKIQQKLAHLRALNDAARKGK